VQVGQRGGPEEKPTTLVSKKETDLKKNWKIYPVKGGSRTTDEAANGTRESKTQNDDLPQKRFGFCGLAEGTQRRVGSKAGGKPGKKRRQGGRIMLGAPSFSPY